MEQEGHFIVFSLVVINELFPFCHCYSQHEFLTRGKSAYISGRLVSSAIHSFLDIDI